MGTVPGIIQLILYFHAGIGISSKAGVELFKPFVQADQSMTRQFGGTGLGLSIAQQLATLMGGKIWYGWYQ